MQAEQPPRRWWQTNLPYAAWWPIVVGAAAGVTLRLVFSGKPEDALSAMSGAFVYLAPMVVGAVTVFIAETQRRRSWAYYGAMGVLANVLFVIGTMAVMIEGLICAIIILPLFCVLGGFAGIVMGAVCRLTNWPKHAVSAFAVLPILLAPALHQEPPTRPQQLVSRSIEIDAAPAAVWKHLLNATDIQPQEVDSAWMYRIGVPLPVSGITENIDGTLVRHVTMGKSIHFAQVSDDWRENDYVRWRYQFSADSFPPHALDDHVVIGGRYFELIETLCSLEQMRTGTTRLTIQMRYRVSTQFDWYAVRVAEVLMKDFEDVILSFYARRAVRDVTGT